MSNRTHHIARYIATAVAVLVLVGALPLESRANFTLSHDEELTVNTSHSYGALYDESQAWIESGGSVTYLYTHDTSTVDISSGSVTYLDLSHSSTVDISGGSVTRLYAYHSSTVAFIARDFHLGENLSLDGDQVLGTGILSGEWFDGTPWTVEITANDSGPTILAIPEPATSSLLALCGLMLMRRASTGRLSSRSAR